ncbi:MAG: helix-turn-helix domain-containing protein [Betaproteobacteria bacterium]
MKTYNLTVSDVSATTGLTTNSVYLARQQGKLPAAKANGRIYFAKEDVDKWRDNTRPYSRSTKLIPMTIPQGGGYNNYRTREISELIAKHVRIGHWTDFGFAIKLAAQDELYEKGHDNRQTLRDAMTTKAQELLRALDTIDKNQLPSNNILVK